jgi:hypothetical protein
LKKRIFNINIDIEHSCIIKYIDWKYGVKTARLILKNIVKSQFW